MSNASKPKTCHHYQSHHRGTQEVPFGEVIGITPAGVPVMSNGEEAHFSDTTSPAPACAALSSFDRHADGVTHPYTNLGVQWQCVEFVRRYIASVKGVWMKSVPTAEDLWSTNPLFVTVGSGEPVPFVCRPNGATHSAPTCGDIVVWRTGDDLPFGHAAVVTEVCGEDGERRVRIAEQNQGFEEYPEDSLFSRELPLRANPDGTLELVDDDPVMGWITVQAPDYDFTADNVADRYRIITGPGTIERFPVEKKVTLPWIDTEDQCGYYLKHSLIANGSVEDADATANAEDVPGAFYFLDANMWSRISRAAASLHAIAMAATAQILADPDAPHLLEHYFGVPPDIQPLLRRAWELTPPMGGRFDFGYDGKRIVMLEYNCDSSAALLECCDTQEKMAQAYNVSQGHSAGSFLGGKCVKYFARLLENDKACPRHRLIHFMIDDDDEERYTALCMARFAEKAGFRTKQCLKLEGFQFGSQSPVNAAPQAIRSSHRTILDRDGEEVLLVWKTWSWDTILHQYAAQKESGQTSEAPTLSDILLNNHVRVLEPLWKAITGSKAILPFMHALAPDHENMLLASFSQTQELISEHYLSKPVNGRAGQNITMFNPVTDERKLSEAPKLPSAGSLRDSVNPSFADLTAAFAQSVDKGNECSAGKFFDSVVVYQRRLFLKKFDAKYFPIFCGWMVGEQFGGIVVREDTSKITKLGSMVVPARVVRGNEPLGVDIDNHSGEEET